MIGNCRGVYPCSSQPCVSLGEVRDTTGSAIPEPDFVTDSSLVRAEHCVLVFDKEVVRVVQVRHIPTLVEVVGNALLHCQGVLLLHTTNIDAELGALELQLVVDDGLDPFGALLAVDVLENGAGADFVGEAEALFLATNLLLRLQLILVVDRRRLLRRRSLDRVGWQDLLDGQGALPEDADGAPVAGTVHADETESLQGHGFGVVVQVGVHELVRGHPLGEGAGVLPHVEVVLCLLPSHLIPRLLPRGVHVAAVEEGAASFVMHQVHAGGGAGFFSSGQCSIHKTWWLHLEGRGNGLTQLLLKLINTLVPFGRQLGVDLEGVGAAEEEHGCVEVFHLFFFVLNYKDDIFVWL